MKFRLDKAAERSKRRRWPGPIARYVDHLRQNFDALAKFSPTVKTDSNGRAVVEIKLPDNLTRYRITAVAVDPGKRFGKYESNITAKQPLMVRPSAPRFMNFGDKIELPVVVQNQTDKDMAVDVAVRVTNAELTGGDGKRGARQGQRPRRGAFPGLGDEGRHCPVPDRCYVGKL